MSRLLRNRWIAGLLVALLLLGGNLLQPPPAAAYQLANYTISTSPKMWTMNSDGTLTESNVDYMTAGLEIHYNIDIMGAGNEPSAYDFDVVWGSDATLREAQYSSSGLNVNWTDCDIPPGPSVYNCSGITLKLTGTLNPGQAGRLVVYGTTVNTTTSSNQVLSVVRNGSGTYSSQTRNIQVLNPPGLGTTMTFASSSVTITSSPSGEVQKRLAFVMRAPIAEVWTQTSPSLRYSDINTFYELNTTCTGVTVVDNFGRSGLGNEQDGHVPPDYYSRWSNTIGILVAQNAANETCQVSATYFADVSNTSIPKTINVTIVQGS